MELKLYRVYGTYGPQADSYIEKTYPSQSAENARIMFEQYMKKEEPWLWEHCMGSRNVHVEKVE